MTPLLKPAVMAAIDRQQSLLYLTLILGQEIFSWDGLEVRDVVDCGAMSRMSDMPAFICGGISWFGEAVPVVDLDARMSRKATPVTPQTRIVVVEMAQSGGQQLLGIIMNPLAPAHGNLRTAADIRRTLGSMVDPARVAEDGEVPPPARLHRVRHQPRLVPQRCVAE